MIPIYMLFFRSSDSRCSKTLSLESHSSSSCLPSDWQTLILHLWFNCSAFLTLKLLKTRELEAKLAEAKARQARVAQEQALLHERQETARAREECECLKQRFDAHQMVEEKLKEQASLLYCFKLGSNFSIRLLIQRQTGF